MSPTLAITSAQPLAPGAMGATAPAGDALVIAQVTAVLKGLLENKLSRYASAAGAGDASVSLLSPDRVSTGADERSLVNLFLYRVAPHSRFGREGNTNGKPPSSAQPSALPAIALDLYYLISAYGSQDFHTEILLGYAVQALNEKPVLKRQDFAGTLAPSKFQHPSWAALSNAPLPLDDVGVMRVTPQFLSMEDTSKLWSSLQARYRPSVAYEVSAVVIEALPSPPADPAEDAPTGDSPVLSPPPAAPSKKTSSPKTKS